ncbi:hypothetical protein D3C75_596090 [compost metagenome]
MVLCNVILESELNMEQKNENTPEVYEDEEGQELPVNPAVIGLGVALTRGASLR